MQLIFSQVALAEVLSPVYSGDMLSSRTNIAIRKGKTVDAKSLAGVFQSSWQQAYSGIIPHLHLQSLVRRRNADWWKTAVRSSSDLLVLELDGKIAGYATLGASRSQGTQRGEIYELYLAPDYQGMGLGEHLFEACRHRLDQRMLPNLVVWALSENTMATDFYWRRGGRPIARAFEQFGSARLEKIAFTWD